MPIHTTVNDKGYYEVEPAVFNGADGFALDSIVAYQTRLQAFANGAMYVLKSDPAADNAAKIEAIQALTNKRIVAANHLKETPPNIKVWRTELDKFNKELEKASGLTRKNIALGEAFWAWQVYYRPRKRVTTCTRDGLSVTQVEILLNNPLTLKQKENLLTIHNLDLDTQPDWFKKMPAWAQTRLKEIVPKSLDGDWTAYEKTIPATLRHIPGEANATKHELFINNVLCGTAYKQGVPTPYDMPLSDQQEHATNNMQQMLALLEQGRVKGFKEYWGLADDDSLNNKCPVLLCGLLTPMQQGGVLTALIDGLGLSKKENNTRFVQQKTTGLESIRGSQQESTYFNLNVPINNLAASTPVSVDKGYVEYAKQLYDSLKNINAIAVNPDLAICCKREKLRASIDALEKHDALPKIQGRNKNLYTAALYDLTTRHMGGVSTGNCKSSKDRKGVALMMADAMEIYYALYQKFPSYDDEGLDRENFVSIYVDLYKSGHQLLIAHDNSPGSPGIKDDELLDKDVVLALGDFYTTSEAVANNNKPQTLFDKQKGTIRNIMLGFGVLLSLVSVGLIATGVLAVPGVLVAALAANLLGVTFNLAPVVMSVLAVIGSGIVAGLAYLGVERFMNKNKYAYHLDNQMEVTTGVSDESNLSSSDSFSSTTSTVAMFNTFGVNLPFVNYAELLEFEQAEDRIPNRRVDNVVKNGASSSEIGSLDPAVKLSNDDNSDLSSNEEERYMTPRSSFGTSEG